MPVLRVLIAVGAGLALADASVVTLALPPILVDLDTTVEGVAAVIGVYTLVLAAALPGAAWLRGRVPDRTLGVAGFGLFAVAGALCATPDAIGAMLAFRAVQAVGAAAALVAAFAFLRGDRLWTTAAVFGTAVGPALGGALTQAFDWRAIFFFQVPIALAAAAACLVARRAPTPEPAADDGARPVALRAVLAGQRGAVVALACLSAALTGVLFLLVLLLVSGWSLEPLAAAAAVSVLPVAAFAGARIRGDAAVRASAGCALVGGGVLALAALPGSSAAWIVAPQLLAGVGMGMALPALAGELLPERTTRQAAGLLSIRHAGITVALLLLAPVAAAQLDDAVADVRERGAALILDARLPPLEKLELAGPLVADLDPVDPRDALRRALDAQAYRFAGDPGQAREYARLTERADDALLEGIDSAFRVAFLIAGGLALVGAVAVLPATARGRTVAFAVAAGALALPVAHAIIRPHVEPDPVVIADPCTDRDLPGTGGIDGLVQDAALSALDRAACRFGSSREELALALADPEEARAYERAHGVDPRSAGGLLEALGIG
jgi:predicted MFS family arabinose efflux permease